MAIISTFTLIRLISVFHLTCAWFLLTAPSKLSEQGIVVLMGQAMDIPPSSGLFKPSEPTALLALVLGFLGATDLLAGSMSALTAIEYWTSQTPFRLFILFVLTAWTYWGGSGSMALSATGRAVGPPGPAQLLQTDLVFTILFIELSLWFWVFISLRDDRKSFADKLVERRAFEEKNQL